MMAMARRTRAIAVRKKKLARTFARSKKKPLSTADCVTAPNFDLKNWIDVSFRTMTQLEIMLGNHWKERVRCAYDTAAELADELAESHKENEELRAKIRELQSPRLLLSSSKKNGDNL